jgi:sensor c-di-GMP phosphodiesterase-like protein
MTNLSIRARLVLLIILTALPGLAIILYSTWDERLRAELQGWDNLQRLATLEAQRQEQIIEGARQTLVAISMEGADDPGALQ